MSSSTNPLVVLSRMKKLPLCTFNPGKNVVTGEEKFRTWLNDWKDTRALFGGNRCGKTETGGFLFVCLVLGEALEPYLPYMTPAGAEVASRCIAEGSRDGWAASVTYGLQAKGNQEKVLKYLPPAEISGYAWQSKPANIISQIRLRNSHTIDFKSYDIGREAFQSAGVGVIWCDEEPPRDIWQEITFREIPGRNLWKILTMTPVMGMTWVYSEIYLSASRYIATVTVGWDDNPHFTEEQKERMGDGLSEDELAMRRNGSFVKRQGLVYKDFNQARNTVDADFEPTPGRHSVYRSMDYGFAEDHPFVCLWAAVDTDGSMVIYDELYLRQSPMDRTVEAVLEKTQPYKARGSWGDSARPDWIDYMNRNGLPVSKAIKDKELGIAKLTSWFLPDAVSGLPRLRISRRCSELIRQLESYSYPKKVRETDRGKRDPEKKDDDGPDALRYLAASYSAGISKSSEAIVYGRGDEVTGYGGKLTRTRSKDAPTGYISKQDSPGFVSYTR